MTKFPTEIIYRAWRNTPEPTYKSVDAKGQEIIKVCSFADPIKHEKYDSEIEGVCTVCGKSYKGGILRKHLLTPTYMDWDIHKEPDSHGICEACMFCLMLNAEAKRTALKNYSFVAADKLYLCSQKDMRDWLVAPPEPPFVMVVSVSHKKHLATKAVVSYSRERYTCMYEETPIDVSLDKIRDCIDLIESLRGIGMTKAEIELGRIRFDIFKVWEQKALLDAIWKVTEYRKTGVLPLALHVAQKKTEEESICILGLIPRTKQQEQPRCSSMQSTEAGINGEAPAGLTCGDKSNGSREPQQREQIRLEIF